MHPFYYLFFFFFNFLTNPLLESKEPVIIFLKGTCSSGKSTLLKSLLATREDIELIDEDAFVHKMYKKAVYEKFPVEYATVKQAIDKENIYHSLRTTTILYKKTATQNELEAANTALKLIQDSLNQAKALCWKQELSQNITKKVLTQIKLAIENKKHVILDAWYIKDEHLQLIAPNTKIYHVTLYCSLPVAYERLLKRNEEALKSYNLTEKRSIGQLIGTYCTLYQTSENPLLSIEHINSQDLRDVFEKMRYELPQDETPRSNFMLREISRSDLDSLEAKLLQSHTKCYISPKQPQDLVIDNTNGNTIEAIHLLETLLD